VDVGGLGGNDDRLLGILERAHRLVEDLRALGQLALAHVAPVVPPHGQHLGWLAGTEQLHLAQRVALAGLDGAFQRACAQPVDDVVLEATVGDLVLVAKANEPGDHVASVYQDQARP
jgi:hypothetical protein